MEAETSSYCKLLIVMLYDGVFNKYIELFEKSKRIPSIFNDESAESFMSYATHIHVTRK
jgi:hypothetical protein